MGEETEADRWWENLPPSRKVQLWRWIEPPQADQSIPGQLDLLDEMEGHNGPS